MKKSQKNGNSELDLSTVTADEFEFILDDMRLQQKTIIANSDFARGTLYNDLKASREGNKPVKGYWVAILQNVLGERSFQISRVNYKYYLENLCK